jgi:hypothetical protein
VVAWQYQVPGTSIRPALFIFFKNIKINKFINFLCMFFCMFLLVQVSVVFDVVLLWIVPLQDQKQMAASQQSCDARFDPVQSASSAGVLISVAFAS